MKEFDDRALREAGNLPLYITEWNSMAVFGAPVHDEKYSAAFIVRNVMDLENKMSGYMLWCMSDIFEEMALIGEPFHGSYGIVNINGIPKPNFWAIKLLSMLYPQRLLLNGKAKEGVEYAAFTDGKNVQVLLYNQSHDYNKHEKTSLTVELNGFNGVTVYRIDDTHCNPKKVWQDMGANPYPTQEEVEAIKERTKLVAEKIAYDGKVNLEISTNDVVMLEFIGA